MQVTFDGNVRRLLPHLSAYVLLALMFWYTYFHEFSDISPLIFWTLWALILSNAAVIVMNAESSAEQFVGILVVLVAILLTKTPASYWPFELRINDDYFELNLAKTIAETGRWDPTAGMGYATDYYGYFPGTHLLIAELGIVLGTSDTWGIFMLGKYLYVPLMSSVQVLFSYMLLREVSKGILDRCFIGITMLLYVSSLGILIMHAGRATFGDTFMIMFLFLLFRQLTGGRTAGNAPLFILSIVGLVLGYHFSQYYLILIISLAIPFLSRSKQMMFSAGRWLIVLASASALWELFVASTVLRQDFFGYIGAITALLFQREVTSKSVAIGYNPIERLLPYLSQGVLVGLAILGLIHILRWKGSRELGSSPRSVILKFVSAFGLAAHIVTGPLIFTDLFFFVFVTSIFSGIGVSVLAIMGMFLLLNLRTMVGSDGGTVARSDTIHVLRPRKRLTHAKTLLIVVALIVIFSGNLLITFSARTLDRGPSDIVTIEDVRNANPQVIDIGTWLLSYSNSSAIILGDQMVWKVLGGYLSIEVNEDASLLTNASSILRHRSVINFIVLNENMGRYTSDTDPELFPASLNQFNTPSFNRVYSNGLMAVIVLVPGE
jgi:hypothetical protein